MEFLLWRSDRGDDFCVIKEPEIEDSWELDDAVPRLEKLSNPVRCRMDPDYPNEIRLSDNLEGGTVPVISNRTKEILETVVRNRVEYLPAELINHKGRVEPAQYFVLHPLDLVDCIDTEASGVQWNRISPGQISRCKSLVLKPDAIPANFTLFRLKHWGSNIIVREDVTEVLEKADLTGLYFRPAQGYKGIG